MSPIIGANQPPIPPKETSQTHASQTHERAGVHNKGKNISSHDNKRELTAPQANVLTPKSINIGDALKLSSTYIGSRTAKQVENKEDEVLTIVGDSWKQKRYQKTLTAVHDNLRKDAEAGALIKQLKEEGAASEALKNKLLSMTVILSQSQFSQGDKRNQYKTFLSHFREAEQEISALSLNNSLEHKLLQKISRALFHCEPSSQFFTNLVQVACSQKAAKLKDSSGPSIAQRLKHTQKEIKKNKAVLADSQGFLSSISSRVTSVVAGEAGLNYDPYLQGNTPYKLFDLHLNEQPTTCIRMGTPIQQKTYLDPTIIPEFKTYISSKKMSEPHLYINRQERTGVEGYRSIVLEEFQNKENTEALTTVTLAADGDLYNQSGDYIADCSFSDLKKTLITNLSNNDEGFFFPDKLKNILDNNDIRDFLSQQLDILQNELDIDTSVLLDQSTRKAIIFHFLNKTLVEGLIRKVKPTTYNNTCKDDIDRGGMANAYMYATTKKPKSTATEAELEMFAQRLTGISHAPAMIVKKREVVEHRFADILNALYKLP